MKKINNVIAIILFIIIFIILTQRYATAQESRIAELNLRPKVEYKAEGLKDPFQPYIIFLGERKAEEGQPVTGTFLSPPTLIVQGIIWGGKFPQAIINERVVKVGDTIEGIKVMQINEEGVTVVFGEQKYILSSPAASEKLEKLQK